MKVKFSPQVKCFIRDWVHILYEKQYFSFYESANEYVSNIVEAIYNTIPHEFLWQTPQQDYFKQLYGENIKYIKHHVPQSRTVWYVFFEYSESEDAALVVHITNGQKDAHRIY